MGSPPVELYVSYRETVPPVKGVYRPPGYGKPSEAAASEGVFDFLQALFPPLATVLPLAGVHASLSLLGR